MLRSALVINTIAGLTRVCTPGKEREMLALRVPDSLDCDVQNITFYDERLLHMFVNKYAWMRNAFKMQRRSEILVPLKQIVRFDKQNFLVILPQKILMEIEAEENSRQVTDDCYRPPRHLPSVIPPHHCLLTKKSYLVSRTLLAIWCNACGFLLTPGYMVAGSDALMRLVTDVMVLLRISSVK